MDLGRLFIAGGVILLIIGLLISWGVPLFRLPGDISIKNGNFGFYFPIMTSIILSIIFTILLNLFLRK